LIRSDVANAEFQNKTSKKEVKEEAFCKKKEKEEHSAAR
jgi:hypothetical protein